MNSGIYKFTFPDGSFYIGKSRDFDRRWKEHSDNMQKGKHTPKIQNKYRIYGLPKFEVLVEAHEHHIDILESLLINSYWGSPNLLNGSKPAPVAVATIEAIPGKYWEESTYSHIGKIMELEATIDRLNDEIERYASSSKYAELHRNVAYWRDLSERAIAERDRLKKRSLWDRIFNT